MGFVTPIALPFFGLFIPVLLLYLLKQRRRRMQVSTLMFWDQILRDEQSVISFKKLRKLLSLLLQLLFIALLTLALARPLLSKDMLGARRIVLFLDTSASMTTEEDGGTRFGKAAALAENVVRGMSLGDTLMLTTVSDTVDVVIPFTNSHKELLDAIAGLEASHGSTHFEDAFDLLEDLPADSRETYVYVISDGAFDEVTVAVPEQTQFAYLRTGEASENVGITAFEARPLPASARDFEILFEAANETVDEQTIPFEIRVGSDLIDAGELTIEAGAREIRSVSQFSRSSGEVRVTLDFDDPFQLDNTAYAVLPLPNPMEVLLVTEGNLFLQSALATDNDVAITVVTPLMYEALPGAAPEKRPSVTAIFDRAPPASAPVGHAIYIGEWPAFIAPATTGKVEDPVVTEFDREHPINRHLRLANVSIETARQISLPEGYTPLIRSFEDTLLALGDDEGRYSMVLTFDTMSSDLPLRVAYPILMANAIRFMEGFNAGEDWHSLDIGAILTKADLEDRARRVHRREGSDGETFSILRPGEEVGESADGAREIPKLLAIDRAGIYRTVTHRGEQAPLFAANMASRRESRIQPSDALPVLTEGPLPEISDGFRLGLEPWFFLVLIALVLIAVEWGLFHRRLVE